MHLTGRTDLILRFKQAVDSRACQRAFDTGTVEVLGGFNPILPGTSEVGWAVRITSVNDSEWYYILVPSFAGYRVRYVGRVHWENWIGDPRAPRWTITSGDNPAEYGRLRDAEAL